MRALVFIFAMAAMAACNGDTSPAQPNPTAPDTDLSDTATPDPEPEDVFEPDPEPMDTDEDVPEPDPVDPEPDIVDPEPDPEPNPQPDAGMDVGEDVGVPPEGVWSPAAEIGAGPRQEVSVVALNGEVYVLGGFNEALQVVPTVEVYNPATDTWRSAQQMPARMHHANAAVVDGKIIVAGFLTGFGFVPDGRVYSYDPDTDAWTAGTRMPNGSERGASGTGAIGSKVYVAGGLRGGAITDFSSYDTETETWEALPDLPIQLDHLVTGVVDGIFYTVGGRNQRIGSHTPRVFAFDPNVGDWAERAPMPTSRAGHAAAVLDGRIYVLGGEGNGDHPSGVFDDNEVYTPATDTWEILAPIPTRRHGTGAAAVDGQIILPGGADVQAFGAIPVVEIFTPVP